jgi:hypothetical protein
MSHWILLAIAALAVLLGSRMRGQRPGQQRPFGQPPDARDLRPPRPQMSPPQPRRRPLPPPLPRPPLMAQPVEAVVLVAQPAPLVQTPGQVILPVLKVEKRPVAPTAAQLVEQLKDRQALRVAFQLREVLGPPVCRRRRLR